MPHTDIAFNARRRLAFWLGVIAVSLGVALHLPMLSYMPGVGLHVMGIDSGMIAGMALITAGIVLSALGLYPNRAGDKHRNDVLIEARDGHLTVPHVIMLVVISLALVIDTMKPSTIGFVLPGLRREYGIARETAALLPLFALTGTVVGSFLWGVLADIYGRKASILLSTIIFIATSICGAMPSFPWNLAMCFLMGASAGGMMPVAYTLLAEMVPTKQRSAMLVLVGGSGLIAVLLPYAAELYPENIRGRATGLIAAGSKSGGIVVQLGGLAGFIPTFGTAALLLIPPIAIAALLVGWVGYETRGRSLDDITAEEPIPTT